MQLITIYILYFLLCATFNWNTNTRFFLPSEVCRDKDNIIPIIMYSFYFSAVNFDYVTIKTPNKPQKNVDKQCFEKFMEGMRRFYSAHLG